MMSYCFGRKSFVVLLCAFCIEVAFAQFPALKQQEWYKKNVLNNATSSSSGQEIIEAAGEVGEESVLQKMRTARIAFTTLLLLGGNRCFVLL